MTCGVCYVAYGPRAVSELHEAVWALRQCIELPIMAIVAHKLSGLKCREFDGEPTGRWAKLNLDTLSPFDHTLYMDVDTRVKSADIAVIFDILADGYDMVIAPSTNQHDEVFSHIGQGEREATFRALQDPLPLQLQAGVFGFRKTEEVLRMFKYWRQEWERGGGQDQAALKRALDRQPLRIWLLSWDWNSRQGAIVEHLFGRAR